ncbi:PAS domain-containing hybrid sensor histidine kinase/response regulator [Pseudoalteromonas rubra]|uniref:PAS domain-containing hybrid sensor histidine kinase/response regulator n=1 Tax=Pseudoalteromonas rubra TaxID=43658 RepID=UPI0009E62552|nr:PAS domain-containing hybrid sensor histidine kinase/response regulator [Pseudoalteromonas rubra]
MTNLSDINDVDGTTYSESDLTAFPASMNEAELLSFLKVSIEYAADEVFWVTSDSRILYVNKAACKKLGYSREELIGMRLWHWDPCFSRQRWPAFWQQLQKNKHIDFETQHQHKSGAYFPVRVRGHLIEQGDNAFLLAFTSDISDIKAREHALQDSSDKVKVLLEQERQKFAEFVNLAPIGIAINYLEGGRFDYINAEFSRFTGYSIDELNQMDYWQLTPKKYAEREAKQIADMAEKGRYGPYKKEYIHKLGHTYPVLLSGVLITDASGQDFIWSIVQDISKQKEVEEQLRAAKEKADVSAFRMQLANDSAGIGVWEWDLLSNALVWDDWMYKLYGISEEAFSGAYEAWENSVHPDDITSAKTLLESAIAGAGYYDTEFRVVHPDGQIRTMKATAEVIRNEQHQAVKVIGVNYDITEKVNAMKTMAKAKQAAENAVKAKSDFLANMSHEIRTPMNAILGGLQLLHQAKLEPDLKVILDNAAFSAQSLLTIINDILDYSKIESNQLTLEQVPFSLLDVLDSVKYDLDSLVSKKGIELIVAIEPTFTDGWLGDLVRVKQILLNLISNAVKFTDQGCVKVVVGCIDYNNRQALCIDVIDSGIGMSVEAQQRIFERFSQADSSTTRKYGGTGLGMSITLSLVKLMNGALELTSQVGKGTQIKVVLPLAQTALKSNAQQSESLSPPDMKGRHILVAEDNKINQMLIKAFLKGTQATLTIVENGKLAVEAAMCTEFDLILMDIHMPEMDGNEAQRQIYARNPGIPVIALTANVMTEDVKGYLAQGFVAHVGKPIDMNSLYQVLANFSVPTG